MFFRAVTTYILILSLALSLLTALPAPALTADNLSENDGAGHETTTAASPEDKIQTLKPVTVVGQPEDFINGTSTLSGDTLQQLPQKNSSLTETITLLPRVQIGEEQRTSLNAGEILPPWVSISGGRAYENYYAVDGVNQGSLLDPLSTNPMSITSVPGHPQRTFLHQDLIESVTVYDSNVPAKFGRFVGGVIDAKTRMPATEFGGSVDFRTTSDSWTEFEINPEDKEDFKYSSDFLQQPRFVKYDTGFEINLPINDEMGLLGAYKTIRSELELRHFNEWHSKDKTLESYFLKYAWRPKAPYSLELTATHTPSKEEFFIKNTRDSDFTIDRGGYTLNGKFSGDTGLLNFDLSAAYLQSENSRNAPSDNFNWKISDSKDWGTSLGFDFSSEGAFGDIESVEQSLQLKADFTVDTFATAGLNHLVSFGAAFTRDDGTFDRKDTSGVYKVSRAVLDSAVVCDPADPSCVDGEQYFRERGIYLAQKAQARINYAAAYLDDLISFGPITLRPGVRLSHDDFMNNTDLAYRLAGSWDLFDNGRTILVAGANRYYGETLLTYKLREAMEPLVTETRVFLAEHEPSLDWEFSKQTTLYNSYSELDTPYSDERTIGVIQKLLGGELAINYVERENEDQFAAETRVEMVEGKTLIYKVLNNNGSSKYESIKVAWTRQWQKHYLNINYTYSDDSASNESDSYDDIFDLGDISEQVWYEGKLIDKIDLPRQDFSRDHILNIIYVGELPWGFTFTNVTKYQSGYETLQDTNKNITLPSGDKYDIYAKVKRPDYWIFDWRLDWQKAICRNQEIVLSLEVNNVFNRTPLSGESDSTYELGRQFWLGLTYNF